MQLAAVAPPANVAIYVLQIRRLQIAPAILVQHRARDIGGRVTRLQTVLELTLDLAEGAAGDIALEALPGEAVLQLNADRSAQGVEAEHRVGTLDVDLVDRDVGDQVPIHRVA